MKGLFILFIIFQNVLGLIIAFLFKFDESLTMRISAMICLFFSVCMFFKNKQKLSNKNGMYCFAFLYFAILLSSLPLLFHYKNFSLVSSEILSFGTRALSGLLMAFWLDEETIKKDVLKWIEPFCIFISSVLLYVAVSNLTTATLPNNAQFMLINRQGVAYGGAYSFGLLLLLKITKNSHNQCFRFFKTTFWNLMSWALIALDIFIVFCGEGKGAFILTIICFLLFLYFKLSYEGFSSIFSVKSIFLVVIAMLGTSIVITKTSIGSNIIYMLKNGFIDRSSNERIVLYQTALEASKSRLFIGLGATSIVYDVGFYSHNLFIDILCDFGLLGVLVLLVLLFKCFSTIISFKNRLAINFVSYIFIFDFVMLLFSGSWMSGTMIWFGLPFLILFNQNRFKNYHKNTNVFRKELC